jgi:Tfp pilus assembly protein PilF
MPPIRIAGYALFAVGAAMAAYFPAINAGFFWDDGIFITQNPQMHTWRGLIDIWSDPSSSPHYYPLLLTVFWILHQFFGDWPTGYHFANIFLHAANAVLLMVLAARLGLPFAWLGASLFLLHPINVQSVAWITEMKNTLSTFLMLAGCLVWAGGERSVAPRLVTARWWSVSLLFVAAMLTKSTSLIMLLALFLVDLTMARDTNRRSYWYALAPLLLLGVAFALFSASFERSLVDTASFPLPSWWEQAGLASWSLFFYFAKLVWPVALAPVYATPDLNLAWAVFWSLSAGLVVAVAFLWTRRASWRPLYALTLYTVFLVPIPFIGIGFTRWYGPVTDHFAYVPSIAFCLAASSLASAACARFFSLRSFFPFALLVCVLLGLLTFRHAEQWRDGSVWERAALNAPQSLAVLNYASHLVGSDRRNEALPILQKFYAESGQKPFVAEGFGSLLASLGRFDEAEDVMRRALRRNPGDLPLWRALGTLLVKSGRPGEAVAALQRSLPSDPDNRIALASALVRAGRLDEASALIDSLPAPSRNNVNMLADLASDLSAAGAYTQAESVLSPILRRFPLGHRARLQLAFAFLDSGRIGEAQEQFSQVVTFAPESAAAISGLAECLQLQGRSDKAALLFQQAVSRSAASPEVLNSYAWFLSTCPDTNFRDPAKAMQMLQKIDEGKLAADHYFQGTLAATMAAQGEYAGAVAAAEQSLALGEAAGDKVFVAGARDRLELYRSGRPYVLPVKEEQP